MPTKELVFTYVFMPKAERLRIQREHLTVARDGTVAYSTAYLKHLRVQQFVIPQRPVFTPWTAL